MARFNYTYYDIVKALKDIGLKKGDNIFIHSNIGFFGRLENAKNPNDYYQTFKKAIFEIIGENGTLINPTFSYSFCNNQDFNPKTTEGVCGLFSELARKDSEAKRSKDANFSVSAIGANAAYFTSDAPEYSFGKNSFWERFLNRNGVFVNFNFDAGSTFIHYVERELKVPYRWDKAFSGNLILGAEKTKATFYHFVYDHQNPDDKPNFPAFHQKAIDLGYVNTMNLGKGALTVISASSTYDLIKKTIKTNPYFLTRNSDR